MPTKDELKMLQSLPLEVKVLKTQQRIREWVTHFGVNGVYVSFSGGKDSTVLLHLVRELYPDVEAVFVNTGLEYPEIQRFVKTFDNVKTLYPEMQFSEVIKTYGYPVISKEISERIYYARQGSEWAIKCLNGLNPDGTSSNFKKSAIKYKPLINTTFATSHKCCDIMKKGPSHKYELETGKKPIVGTMANESHLRKTQWIKTGCNAFESDRPRSAPISFWTEQDIYIYIKMHDLKISSVYGDIMPIDAQLTFEGCEGKLCTTGCYRTGCIFCGFGAHLDKCEGRFQRLKRTHPKQYDFCINGGAYDTDGIWKPDSRGLGMGHVFDVLNSLYGKDFIKYK